MSHQSQSFPRSQGFLVAILAAVFTMLAAIAVHAQFSLLPTVERLRAEYPTPMQPAQVGELVTRVAAAAGPDWGVLLKPGGNNCPSVVGAISCDIVVHIPTQQEYDILGDIEGPAVPSFSPVSDRETGLPVKCGTPGKSGCDMARVVRVASPPPAPSPAPSPSPAPVPPAPVPPAPAAPPVVCDVSALVSEVAQLRRDLAELRLLLLAPRPIELKVPGVFGGTARGTVGPPQK